MSEFEYLAVFVAIIFGVSVTHILRGVIRSIYRGDRDEVHFVLTAFLFFVLILNWWTWFGAHDQETWSFDLFFAVVIWSITHYVCAITLYPPLSVGVERPFEFRRNWFYVSFIAVSIMDMLQTGLRGDLFDPWYYLVYVGHFVVVLFVGILVPTRGFHRILAWFLLIGIILWSFIERRFLL